jgi:hypothetical protein
MLRTEGRVFAFSAASDDRPRPEGEVGAAPRLLGVPLPDVGAELPDGDTPAEGEEPPGVAAGASLFSFTSCTATSNGGGGFFSSVEDNESTDFSTGSGSLGGGCVLVGFFQRISRQTENLCGVHLDAVYENFVVEVGAG